jgi:hypothetical protein
VPIRGIGLQPQAPLTVGQVARERHHRRGVGNRTQLVAHDQLILDQRERPASAFGQYGTGSIEHLVEAGLWPTAQHGCHPGQSHRGDHVVG